MSLHNKLRVPTVRERRRMHAAAVALKNEGDALLSRTMSPAANNYIENAREPPSLKWVFRLTFAALFCIPLGLLALKENRVTPSERASREKANKIEYEKQVAIDLENAREKARFKCLSSWSGEMPDFVSIVKKRLSDPSSFGHIKTVVSAVNIDGSQYITMQFRAHNGFGGLTVGTAKGTVQNDTCEIVDWKLL